MGIMFYILCMFINIAVIANIDRAVEGNNFVKLFITLTGPMYTGAIIGQVIVKYLK